MNVSALEHASPDWGTLKRSPGQLNCTSAVQDSTASDCTLALDWDEPGSTES